MNQKKKWEYNFNSCHSMETLMGIIKNTVAEWGSEPN